MMCPFRRLYQQLRPYERRDILMNCVSQIEARRDEIKGALILEAGKPLRDAEAEIGRAIDTVWFSLMAINFMLYPSVVHVSWFGNLILS